MDTMRTLLGPTGPIAAAWPRFEARAEQVEMAEAVADALAQKKPLLVEAGTGVGKSFAYLLPAVKAVAANKNFRVVVSTHTIGLQEQLLKKDIPFLQKVLSDDFKPILVKGRGNYLSPRRLRVAQQRAGSLVSDPVAAAQLVQIGRWSRQTTDGTRSDLPFVPQPAVWQMPSPRAGIVWVAPAPIIRTASISRPAGRRSRPTCSSSTTRCSSATWRCASPAAGCYPITTR